MKTDKIYYGAAYYDEYMPVSRVEEDMKLMKAAGMNVIRIAESTWSTWEPREGVFDFTSLHRMLQGAEKYGISVIVGTPTYAIPSWMVKKYPDVLADTHEGPAKYGHRQNMDITHPAYRFHCERIIRRLMEEVQGYGHVIGFQLDNETKPYDTCGERVQKLFKNWLSKKFGTVEKLNQAFGLAYWSNSMGAWDDLPDVRGTINGSLAAEFEAFQRSLVTEFLSWQRKIIDEYRRENQFVTHNFDYEWKDYSYALQPDADQFEMAKSMTVAGCDIYHPSGASLTGVEISFGGDLARALKGGENFFVLETQAQGQVGRLPWPGRLRLQALAHLANGANMVEYWHWHSIHNGIESHWKGVLSHDFTPGAVYQEVAETGKLLERVGSHLVNLKKDNFVAVMVSNKSCTGMKHSAAFAGPDYGESLRWIYDVLYKMNVSCDMIHDSFGELAKYKVVILPALYCADEDLKMALREYVEQGGHVIAGYRSLFTDENVKILSELQPGGMSDVFGMTYDNFTVPVNVPFIKKWMELLRPFEDTEILMKYEHDAYKQYAAVTRHSYGKGSAVYIGAMLEEERLEEMLKNLLPEMGIELRKEHWPLIIKEGVNEQNHQITYVFNYSTERICYQTKSKCRELLTDKLYAVGENVELTGWNVAIFESEGC